MILTTSANECSSSVQGLDLYLKLDITIFKYIFLFFFLIFLLQQSRNTPVPLIAESNGTKVT